MGVEKRSVWVRIVMEVFLEKFDFEDRLLKECS